ncbi:MAG: interleukin-like EMT inducer domain-containing protein [Chloroflexota bacterium]
MNASLRITQHVSRYRPVIVLLVYLALALALTYPLVTQFADHVPGTTTWSLDEYGYVWNNWWFKRAVFDLDTNPFQTDFIFYPVGTSLVLYTFTLLHVLLGLPIQFAFGLIPASNVELLFAFVASAYGTYLLVRYLIQNSKFKIQNSTMVGIVDYELRITNFEFAAFVAGALFAFSSNRFVYASLGHYNVVASEWLPFYILFLIKTVRETKWRNALLAGLFAAFTLYVETTFGVLLALFTALYLLFEWRAVWRRATIARLGLIVAFAALLFAPLLLPMLDEIFNRGYALPGWGHAEKLLVDLFGFFVPTSLHPLNRNWVQELDLVRQGISRFADVNTVFVGYVTLALALSAAIRFCKPLKVWVMSALVFAVLSLGPLLHIGGKAIFDFDGLQVTFPMPFLLLHYIPLLKENRAPNRFSVLVMLSLAVLVGFAIMWACSKLRTKSRMLALLLPFAFLLLILFEHLAIPLPLTDARVPEVYAQIARAPGDFSVLTLPLGWRNSFGQQGAEDTRVQYYQSAHGKYIFPANIQRNPPFLFEYFDRIPIFHSIAEIESYNPISDQDRARDKALAPALMAFFDIRYVVIHPAIPGRPPYSDTRSAVVNYLQQVLPLGEKIYDRDGVIGYRVNQAPISARQVIAFGADSAYPYQAEGWGRAETLAGLSANWATQTRARVLFPIREISDYALTISALPYTYSQSPAQTLEIFVNAQSIQKFAMKSGWSDYAMTIPARALRSGLNDLVLQFGYAACPRDVLPANFAIGATGASSPVDIAVSSSALGSIKVNGREVSPLGRGYNVVVIDPKSGAVVSAKSFNTADDRAQSRAMTDFLAQAPNGFIVAVAAQEDAGANLGDRTAAMLRAIGGQIDPRENPTRAHALIGVKGATPGAALEQSNEGAAFVSVGHSADERTLAAAVSTVVIEKK